MRLFHLERRLYEGYSADTLVQVIEKADRRELRFGNTVVQSAHSRRTPDFLLLEYIRAMMAGFLFRPTAEYVLHLGLGAGSLARFIHQHFPQVRQRVMEINPAVIDVAYRFFELPVSPRLLVRQGDGAEYVRDSRETYDLIFVDAFGAEGPASGLGAPAFHESVRRRLTSQGWVVHNVWGSDSEGLRAMTRLMAAAYPVLFSLSVRSHSNVILIGGKSPAVPTRAMLKSRAAALSRQMPLDFTKWSARLIRVGGGPPEPDRLARG